MVLPEAIPVVLDWLRENDDQDTRVLRIHTLAYIEALEVALEDMVNQHCACDRGGILDSSALSANADAMHLLAQRGFLTIEKSVGRRVIAKWAERETPK